MDALSAFRQGFLLAALGIVAPFELLAFSLKKSLPSWD